MRGLIRAAAFALFVGAATASSASAQAAPKFGFINSAAILSEAPGRAEAENQFKAEVADTLRAHLGTVFLSKERHRALLKGVGVREEAKLNRKILQDLFVYSGFQIADL